MKKLASIIAFSMMVMFSPQVLASVTTAQSFSSSEIISHGGGCRKDSPQGQCCHAGSKPYHCH
jgi:hypothetical protein